MRLGFVWSEAEELGPGGAKVCHRRTRRSCLGVLVARAPTGRGSGLRFWGKRLGLERYVWWLWFDVQLERLFLGVDVLMFYHFGRFSPNLSLG